MTHRTAAALAVALAATAAAAPAAAGGPPGLAPDTASLSAAAAPQVERYGSELLLADLAWVGATLALAATDQDDTAGSVATIGYLAAGPAIHLRHGNLHGASRSAAARTLLPLGGLVLGMMLAGATEEPNYADCVEPCTGYSHGGGFRTIAFGVLGASVGVASAMVLDWTTLGRKTVARPATTARLLPRVGVSGGGFSVGVTGRF
jgi:hypothetical protein